MSLKNRLEPILIEGIHIQVNHSLRASSPVWASETGLARTRATIPYKFSFVLRPDEGEYHCLKNDVPEIKVD